VGSSGTVGVYTRAVIEQGACAFKKGVLKKSCSVVAWKKM
jgi:hypothetical protein